MIFALFIFLNLVTFGLIILGVLTKHPVLVSIGAVFCILTGALLYSEGLRNEWDEPTWEKNDNTIYAYDANALTPLNDNTVAMLAPTFMYGGFIVLIFALGFVAVALREYMEERGKR